MKGLVRARMVPSAQADSFYVLKRGEILGPFSGDELKAQTETGQFSNSDLVQKEGLPIWQPLGRVLGIATGDALGAIAPDWRAIFTWAWIRLRFSLAEQSLYTGAVCLGIGTVALLLSRWPFVYWFPWFGTAAAAAVVLLRRQRAEHALLLLAGVVCIPMFFMAFGLKAATRSSNVTPAEAVTMLASTTPADPSPTPAVVVASSKAELLPRAEPLPAPAIPEVPALQSPTASQPAAPIANSNPSPTTIPSAPSQPLPKSESTAPTEGPGFVQRTVDLFSRLTGKSSERSANSPNTENDATSRDFIQSHTDAFVMIKGLEGEGSGFICRVGSQPWLFTNIHVIAGMQQPQFTRVDGGSVALGTADLAVGHDIIRFAMTQAPQHPLEAITDFANEVRIGDDVVVLGNSGGGGVITNIKGTVLGIGPDRIEVSAKFVPGNSGSPIIHVKTGKVIGVATYLTKRYDEFAEGNPGSAPSTPAPQSTPGPRFGPVPPRDGSPSPVPSKPSGQGAVVIRRFAYRIDTVRKWEPVNWALFRQESEQLRQISLLTEDVFDFVGALRDRTEPQFQTDTLRRAATQWMTTLRGYRVSSADRLRATEFFLRTLRSMVRTDVTAAEARLRYSYFRENLRHEREVRDRLYDAFDTQTRRMTSPSERFGG